MEAELSKQNRLASLLKYYPKEKPSISNQTLSSSSEKSFRTACEVEIKENVFCLDILYTNRANPDLNSELIKYALSVSKKHQAWVRYLELSQLDNAAKRSDFIKNLVGSSRIPS